MRTMKVLALLAVVAIAVPLANAADTKHSVGVFVNYLWTTGDWSGQIDTETSAKIEADSAMGYGLGYRYMFTPKWDFGASIFQASRIVAMSFCEPRSW